jgi:osmoprotectant transport system permease protein
MESFIDFVISRWDDVVESTIEHVIYVVSVIFTATIIALATGIFVRTRPVYREVILGVYSVFLTIPSLALFVLFIPILGLGFWPPYVALTMYALLPIARNTVTGLAGVDPAIVESARGMGLSNRQRLWKIEMPLAWPVIVTGIRVSTLLVTGIAAIATLVAGGGLGDFIKSGLARIGAPNAMEAIWTGTVFVVLLALILDAIFIGIRRLSTSEGLR